MTKNDGLFAPLMNITTETSFVFSGEYYVDRFLFRLPGTSYQYQTTTIYEFNPRLILDDVNNATIDDLTPSPTNYSDYGNLSGFFINLQNVTDVTGFMRNTGFINYTLTCQDNKFKFPKGITSLNCAMNSVYGSGEIVLSELFDDCSNIKDILCSFQISNGDVTKVEMTLNNNTFSEFKALERLGYVAYVDGNHANFN